MPPRRSLGRTLREIFQGDPDTSAQRAERGSEVTRRQREQLAELQRFIEAQQQARPVVNPDTLRDASAPRRWSNTVSMVILPVDSGSPGAVHVPLSPTIVRSGGLPRDLTPSVPLQDPPQQPTVSSSPAAIQPPLPIAWDDPTVKRVRRVVIEDE